MIQYFKQHDESGNLVNSFVTNDDRKTDPPLIAITQEEYGALPKDIFYPEGLPRYKWDGEKYLTNPDPSLEPSAVAEQVRRRTIAHAMPVLVEGLLAGKSLVDLQTDMLALKDQKQIEVDAEVSAKRAAAQQAPP